MCCKIKGKIMDKIFEFCSAHTFDVMYILLCFQNMFYKNKEQTADKTFELCSAHIFEVRLHLLQRLVYFGANIIS